jgi:hypothetical protein
VHAWAAGSGHARRADPAILDRFGFTPSDFDRLYPWQSPPYFGEGLFTALGASSVTAMDNSAYEGASSAP